LMHVAPDTIVDGRYRALKRLGAGGMAEVWCAEDEVLGRRVALKLLGSRFAEDPEFRERFRREAQAAAGLAHPNIVGIFDRAEWEGTPYIAMELVDGRTLKEMVTERGPLPPAVAVNFVEQMLRALGYAHRRGIVHRDVKPQNVIIDREGTAKVADFGIARAANSSDMTQTGTMVGTVQYFSPEQAQGLPVDPRSDLYSAGVVLYELLTGRLPFEGEAPVSIALKHVNERPVPPGQLRPGLPPALEAVVMRSMEKDPALRYQSADEFIAALEAAMRAPMRPIVVDPAPVEPWVEEELERSHWWMWVLGILVVVALLIGAYFVFADGKKVTVPDVVGREATEAADSLHKRGLEVDFKTVESSKPTNEVIDQDPSAGSEVKEGSTVVVTVSGGRGTTAVPDVVGQSRDDAEQALTDAGFTPKVVEAFSDDVEQGNVISVSPAAGQQATKGRTVTLTVSKGPQGVPLPNLVGTSQADAEAQLQQLGLSADVSEVESSEAPGTVLKQSPGANTPVTKGSTVQLQVAKARPTIPDVTTGNPTVDDATKTLEDAGYKVKTVERQGDPTLAGRVIGQSPEAGTKRSSGGTVTIAVVPEAGATPTPTPTPTIQ
jgi:beta-lactam-binding protein with PASTA domain